MKVAFSRESHEPKSKLITPVVQIYPSKFLAYIEFWYNKSTSIVNYSTVTLLAKLRG